MRGCEVGSVGLPRGVALAPCTHSRAPELCLKTAIWPAVPRQPPAINRQRPAVDCRLVATGESSLVTTNRRRLSSGREVRAHDSGTHASRFVPQNWRVHSPMALERQPVSEHS